jgi:hypothetical protein
MAYRTQAIRPMRDLMANLPRLPLTKKQEVDFQAASPDLLVAIADAAETTMNVIHVGVGALGLLLANSSVVIEDGTISADSVEGLGHLIAEISEMASSLMILAARCRRETVDYSPQ